MLSQSQIILLNDAGQLKVKGTTNDANTLHLPAINYKLNFYFSHLPLFGIRGGFKKYNSTYYNPLPPVGVSTSRIC